MAKYDGGACIICGDPAIEAHLFPKAFCKLLPLDDNDNPISDFPVVELDKKSKFYPSKTGVRDNSILCQKCDNLLGVLDKYAFEKLEEFKSEYIYPNRRELIRQELSVPEYILHKSNICGEKLLLFALSVIWRFSVSRCYGNDLHLGPYKDLIKRVLFNGEPLPPSVDGHVTVVVTENRGGENNFRTPVSFRINNARAAWFYLCGFRFVAKFDQRPFYGIPREAMLKNANEVFFLLQPWKGSPEEKIISRFINEDHPAMKFLSRKLKTKR